MLRGLSDFGIGQQAKSLKAHILDSHPKPLVHQRTPGAPGTWRSEGACCSCHPSITKKIVSTDSCTHSAGQHHLQGPQDTQAGSKDWLGSSGDKGQQATPVPAL